MKKSIGFSLVSVLFLYACSHGEVGEIRDEAMSLTGRVEGSAANVSVTIGADYTHALPVAFARIDNDMSYADVNEALSATRGAGASSTEIRFNNPQYYQPVNSTNSESRLVGWFPAVTPVSGILSFDISEGSTDVLLTQELTGRVDRPFCEAGDPFLFSHRLCQIIVSVTASSEETVRKWGSLTSVTLKEMPTNYIITLPSTSTVSGTTDVVLNRRGGTSKMSPVVLSAGHYVECGYLLTLPQGTSLTVALTGSSGEQRLIQAPLPAGEVFCGGYLYQLRLNLDGLQSAPCTLTSSGWGEEINLGVEF